MKEWVVSIIYNLNAYKLRAVLEYESDQIMRIRVYGTKGSILLQNDYPARRRSRNTRAVKWQVREGNLGSQENDQLRQNICKKLEYHIKDYFEEKRKGELGFQ